MKAVETIAYGSVDVLKVSEIEKPEIGIDEICVRVKACSVNPIDWKIRSGYMKMITGANPPKILGGDFSGIVEELGKNVKDFKIGDEVWGHINAIKGGAYAEYVKVSAINIAHKPVNFDFYQSAAIPLAGLTAYQSLVNLGNIKAGSEVLINGCTGGVGSIAVQIAKALNCKVTGVCSTKNIDFAKNIGADDIIDYKKDDLLKLNRQFDSIYDFVGNLSFSKSRKIMKSKGVFVSAVPTLTMMLFGGLFNLFRSKKCKTILVKSSSADLDVLKEMAESSKLKSQIEKIFPLDQVQQAHTLSETGRVVGKIVMTID